MGNLAAPAGASKLAIRIFRDYYYRSKFHVLSFDSGGDAASATAFVPVISVN